MTIQQFLEDSGREFDKKFPLVECSAHERTSSARCICEELPDINEEKIDIKSFLTSSQTSLIEKMVEEIEEIRENTIKEDTEYAHYGITQASRAIDRIKSLLLV